MKNESRVKNGRLTKEFNSELVEYLWELKYEISKQGSISLNDFFAQRKMGSTYPLALRKINIIEKIGRGKYKWISPENPNPMMANLVYDCMHEMSKVGNQKAKQKSLNLFIDKRPSTKNSGLQDYKEESKKAIKVKKEKTAIVPNETKAAGKEISFLWGAFKYKTK